MLLPALNKAAILTLRWVNFKLSVVGQFYIAGNTQSLNIKANLLYNWKKHEEQSSRSMLNTQEKTELIQLRKENKRLKMEKEILKKASAFFAKEMK